MIEQPLADLDYAFPPDVPQGNASHFDPHVKPAAAELPVATAKESSQPLKLSARSAEKKSGSKSSLAKPMDSLITVGGSLCVVLAVFFGLAVLTRRGTPKNLGKLPGEVIEVLGKTPLVKGQDLQLVRIGAKLLLICITPTGCETLTEITNDEEVARLSSICRKNSPTSVTAAFNQMLTTMGREPASGFTGAARSSDRRGGRHA